MLSTGILMMVDFNDKHFHIDITAMIFGMDALIIIRC